MSEIAQSIAPGQVYERPQGFVPWSDGEREGWHKSDVADCEDFGSIRVTILVVADAPGIGRVVRFARRNIRPDDDPVPMGRKYIGGYSAVQAYIRNNRLALRVEETHPRAPNGER